MSSTSLRTGVDLKRPQTEHHCLSLCLCWVLLYFVLIFPQVLSSDVVFSDAAGAPHPGTAPQEGQAWPNRQSSSGRPGSSRTPPHTAAWGSLCPTPAVCCTEGKKGGAGGGYWKGNWCPEILGSWVTLSSPGVAQRSMNRQRENSLDICSFLFPTLQNHQLQFRALDTGHVFPSSYCVEQKYLHINIVKIIF